MVTSQKMSYGITSQKTSYDAIHIWAKIDHISESDFGKPQKCTSSFVSSFKFLKVIFE